VLVTIGIFFGEGFNYAQLATLFFTLPISWRGTLAQYAGRLHRPHATKREVLVYVDVNEPMLAKMAAKRETGYRSLGYRKADEAELALGPPDAACSSSFADRHDPRLQTSRCANPTSTRLIRSAETMSIIQSSSLVPVFLGECQFNNEFKRLRGRCTKIPRVRILLPPPAYNILI
jgi:superfamily II DNA or RNA helicase